MTFFLLINTSPIFSMMIFWIKLCNSLTCILFSKTSTNYWTSLQETWKNGWVSSFISQYQNYQTRGCTVQKTYSHNLFTYLANCTIKTIIFFAFIILTVPMQTSNSYQHYVTVPIKFNNFLPFHHANCTNKNNFTGVARFIPFIYSLTHHMLGTGLFFIVSAVLSTSILILLSSSVSSSYFNLAVPIRKCLGNHSCTSSHFQ